MSANTPSNTGSALPSSAGTRSPDWCISAASPTVFIATVLPPVLGPVITSADQSGPMCAVSGTASLSSRGCLARISLRRCPEPADAGVTASSRRLYRARASARSSIAVVRLALLMSPATAPTRLERSRSTRLTSRSSSSASSRHSLQSSTVVKGSTKTVAPVFEASWTIPDTRCRLSALTGTTNLSPRTEMIGSWSASLPVLELMNRCRASLTCSYAART